MKHPDKPNHVLKKCILFFVLMLAMNSLQAQDKQYYVNSVTGLDANAGTIEKPWKTLAKVRSTNFQPGDIINFALGSSFAVNSNDNNVPVLLVDDSGTALKPITFRAYNGGNADTNKPSFSNPPKWGWGIKISADYIIFDGLHVTNTGDRAFFFLTGSDHNIVRNCEVSFSGVAFYASGSNNLFTHNYIHDLKVVIDDTGEYCHLPKTDPLWSRNPCDNDYGATVFWFHGANNEVSYNRAINNIGHSYDYKFDGGFLELYGSSHNTYVHHNWVDVGMGILESSSGLKKNITIAYNVFIENKGLFAAPKDASPMENFKFENNTCITRTGTIYNNMLNWFSNTINLNPETIIVRNNIFVLAGAGAEVTKNNKFTHTNNLYYLTNGATLGSLVLGPGEKLGNPLFENEAAKDFRLKDGSAAKNMGANLGYSIDYNGNPVPSGGIPDAGAYEFQGTVSVPEINVKQGTVSILDGTGSFAFGNVTFGTSNTVTFTVENTGTAALSLTGTPRVVVTGTGFSRVVDAPVSVSASGTATFQVRFQPNAAGSFSGTISIANNDANENPYNFAITGTGTKANQTITFNALPAKVVGDADFNAGATSSAGLSVSYTSSNTAVATIVDGLIHVVGAGTSVITASQPGSTNYNAAASVTQTLTVASDVNISNWTLSLNAGAVATATSVTQAGFSGKVAKVSNAVGGTAGWHIQFYKAVPVTQGKTYTVTFKASADANRTIDIGFQQNKSPFTSYWTKMGIELTTTPTNYGPYTFDCTVTDLTDIFKFMLGNSTIPVYIDDVVITESQCTNCRVDGEGKESFTANALISAYPNPAVDELNVTFHSEKEADASVELMTTMSQVVSRKSLCAVKGSNTTTLDVRGLDAGMYFLNVKNGSVKAIKKIIIER